MKTCIFILAFFIYAIPATATNIKICFEVQATYSDTSRDAGGNLTRFLTGNTTEDYWTYQTDMRLLRGNEFSVVVNGLIVTGNLGDGLGTGDPGIGCVDLTPSAGSGTLSVTLKTIGVVQGNTVDVRDGSLSTPANRAVSVSVPFSGAGTYIAQFTPTAGVEAQTWRAYAVDAYALYRHAGGLSGESVLVLANDTVNPQHTSCTTSRLSTSGTGRKFTAVHELGHWLTCKAVGSKIFADSNCTTSDAVCPGAGGDNHSMGSIESNGCALQEGVAHFYAADVFNNDDEDDCAFFYYKQEFTDATPDIDCEINGSDLSRTDGFPLKFMETNCSTASGGLTGRGTEIDWLRTLWDVHTNATTPPTFTAIMNWMAGSGTWSSSTAFSTLDTGANSFGGQLNTDWDSMKTFNGIDH